LLARDASGPQDPRLRRHQIDDRAFDADLAVAAVEHHRHGVSEL